jgi:hypothetical protein
MQLRYVVVRHITLRRLSLETLNEISSLPQHSYV